MQAGFSVFTLDYKNDILDSYTSKKVFLRAVREAGISTMHSWGLLVLGGKQKKNNQQPLLRH